MAPVAQRARLTGTLVRDLAGRRGVPAVTSVYLDVDGGHRPVPADYRTAFARLAGSLHQRARSSGDGALRRAVDADIAQMREWLDRDLDRSATRGLALFSCQKPAFFEVVELPRPVDDRATFGPAPHVTPLVAALDEHEPFLVALIDRRRLRVLRVDLGEATELPGIEDLPERAVDDTVELGSFERHAAEAARGHQRRAARRVKGLLAQQARRRLVVAGPDEVVAGLEEHLPVAARRMIAGRASISVSASPRDVVKAALPVVEAAERHHEAEVVEDLRQRAAAGRGGVVGLEPTLAALALGRVRCLVVLDGFTAPGARCPSCGWRGLDLRVCPVCRTLTVEIADVVDLAVAEALDQGATVELCQDTELERFGSIGAIERYTHQA